MPGRIDFAVLESLPLQRSRARVDIVGVKRMYAHGDGVNVSTFTPAGSDRVKYMEVTPAPGTRFHAGDIADLVARAALGDETQLPYELSMVSFDEASLTPQAVEGTREVVLGGRNYSFRIETSPVAARLYPPAELALTVDSQKALASGLENACVRYEHLRAA